MSAKDGFETGLLEHIFQNANIANIGDGTGLRGSSAAGYFWFSLYISMPDDSASGAECNYYGYGRVPCERSVSGFSVVGNNVSNASALVFGQCVSGDTDIAVGFAVNVASGVNVDDAIIWGGLQSAMSISSGTTPNFAIGDLNINVD